MIRPATIARNASTLYPRTSFSVGRSMSAKESRKPGRKRKQHTAISPCSRMFVTVNTKAKGSSPGRVSIAHTIPPTRSARHTSRTTLFVPNR